MRGKQTWPCLQLPSHWICACSNYIVSQARSLCPSVLWHRQSISVAFSISVVMFVKSVCLQCVLRLLLCLAKCTVAECCSLSVKLWFNAVAAVSYCGLQIFCWIHCHLFNGQQAVNQIPVSWNLYGSLSKWEVTRLTGQRVWTVEQRAKCHTIPCQMPILAVIMRFVLSNEPQWSVESINFFSCWFADDTVLFFFANAAHSATEILQQAFDKLQDAFFNLKLVLHENKTKLDVVDNRLHITTLNGHSIEWVSEYKYLGLWLD